MYAVKGHVRIHEVENIMKDTEISKFICLAKDYFTQTEQNPSGSCWYQNQLWLMYKEVEKQD